MGPDSIIAFHRINGVAEIVIDGVVLTPHRSQQYLNPTINHAWGLDWHGGVSSMGQLAFALLLEANVFHEEALNLRFNFRDHLYVAVPEDGGELTGAAIFDWLDEQAAARPV